MKLADIARLIGAHLTRFECDPEINRRDPKYKTVDYFMVSACARGSRVFLRYISYQGEISLTKQEALDYLAWLDAGNVGRHWAQKRAAS